MKTTLKIAVYIIIFITCFFAAVLTSISCERAWGFDLGVGPIHIPCALVGFFSVYLYPMYSEWFDRTISK